MSYEQLPPELLTAITENLSIADVRLLNKTTLKANDKRFCENVKITSQDMVNYINNTNDKIVIFVPSKAYIYEHGTLNSILIKTYRAVTLYTGYDEPISLLKSKDINELDLYSLYIIYKNKNCDKIIRYYSKNKVIKILNDHVNNIHDSEFDKYLYLISNAIALNLRKPVVIAERMQLNNLLKEINNQLYMDILNFLNQLE